MSFFLTKYKKITYTLKNNDYLGENLKYKEDYNVLDKKIFEQMAKEYYKKQEKFQNVGVLNFDVNSTFKTQLEQVLNVIYAINLKQNRNKNNKNYDKLVSIKIQLNNLDKSLFNFYTRLYRKIYLMPIHTKLDVNYTKSNLISDYFLLLRALIDCDFYMLNKQDRIWFKETILKYFKVIFKLFNG